MNDSLETLFRFFACDTFSVEASWEKAENNSFLFDLHTRVFVRIITICSTNTYILLFESYLFVQLTFICFCSNHTYLFDKHVYLFVRIIHICSTNVHMFLFESYLIVRLSHWLTFTFNFKIHFFKLIDESSFKSKEL